MSSGIKALFYLLSLLIPLAGFIIGAIYYSKDDPDSKHVGKICLVLAVVGILLYVGLSALLYVLTLGYSSDGPGQTPAASLTKTTIANGVKFTVNAVSRTTTWSDVEIFLSDGADFGDWSPSAAYLSGSGVLTETFAAITMGDLAIFCNVTDLAGNGNINAGDYFTFTTGSAQMFSSATTYTVTLMYEPTAEQMCNVYFTG
jgi:FlaG/FlaF family flagellin (archaellin)